MATRKKTKPKAKAQKKTTARKTARKKTAGKTTRTKVTAKKKTVTKGKATSARTTATPKPSPALIPLAVPAGEERIGIVTHYYTHLMVAIVQLESGTLREGDIVHIKGHTSDFNQRVESMQVDHVRVNEAHAGQSFGLRVKEHAREHDVVYKAIHR